MIPDATLIAGRADLSAAFVSATPNAQLRVFTPTEGAIRPADGTWADEGASVRSCLYSPKGNEIPQPIAMLDRTVFWLAWDDDSWPITPQKRVVIDGIEYEVHDDGTERTNQFLRRAMISRLK